MKTIKFYTLGCKVNQYDTQSIRERFIKAGFKEIFNGHKADFYLINTCTVTHKADKDSRYYIHKARKLNPRARIIVTGCMAQRTQAGALRLEGADYIISKRFFPDGIRGFSGHTRAFLKVQDGCDNFCSYCIVPLVRGSSRSRAFLQVIREAKALVKNGFKEIVLTGICLGAYGKDLKPGRNLVDIIEELEKIDGLLRIRLSSIEAGDVTDELINKMNASKKLCRHLHIPMQSGDDGILKKMNRKYTKADYIKLIKKLKDRIPGIAITTDVLVGFPGESEENFQNTLNLIKEISPLKVHIFPYSKREGTSAACNFDNPVAQAIVKNRVLELQSLAEACAGQYKKKFLHKKMPVLIESRLMESPEYWQGLTDNYIKVLVKSNQDLTNQVVAVNPTKLLADCMLADLY
jgi:threonylcarbamoyladenosine tRNA methylthiotransferase MtaB